MNVGMTSQVSQVMKKLPASAGDGETWVQSLGQEDFLEEEMQPTPVLLSRKSQGQRNLGGYSHWSHRVIHDGANI